MAKKPTGFFTGGKGQHKPEMRTLDMRVFIEELGRRLAEGGYAYPKGMDSKIEAWLNSSENVKWRKPPSPSQLPDFTATLDIGAMKDFLDGTYG